MARRSPLLDFLAGRSAAAALTPEAASLLVAEARTSGVLARVAGRLLATPDAAALPPPIVRQCAAAGVHAAGFRRDVMRELRQIEDALDDLGERVVVLKGAAYVALGLPAADGRIFSDIDILVDRPHVGAAEAALMLAGWSAGKLDDYDERYYRQWSHETPPLTHLRRGTTIDLHHSLVMPTCRIKVDSARMIADAVPVADGSFWWRLRDEDMILHAMSHLVLNSEFERGLRDLWDIDLLYRHFCAQADDFPARLLARARQVGLDDALRQALGVAARVFATPVAAALQPPRPSAFARLLALAASTRHPQTRHPGQPLADFVLMLREVALRLPWPLLCVHLAHKATQLFAAPAKTKI